MKMLFAILLGLIGMTVPGQDSWKVCLDKKVLLNTSSEDTGKNVIRLSLLDLQKSKTFIVAFRQASPQKGWERTITAYDEKNNELEKQKGKTFSLKTSELKILLDKFKTITIYTINSPSDPKIKSQVRLRRVHLCTLVLQ